MNIFNVTTGQFGITAGIEFILEFLQHGRNDLFTGTDHHAGDTSTLPVILVVNLCGADRKPVTATRQDPLQSAPLLLQTLHTMQSEVSLKNSDHHVLIRWSPCMDSCLSWPSGSVTALPHP